ncbi:MAG: synthase subunit epsilon [Burkholderiaceae bacterium]|nr:synthase subunit epsilon [Burkholderiaceae bacterium]
MAKTIQVEVVSAEEQIFSGAAEFVALPAELGEIGVLPGHTPLITRIKPGTVRIKLPEETEQNYVFVAGGILEVQPNKVTVLADTAIRGRDLDEAKVQEAKKQAEEALGNRESAIDYAKAQAEIALMVAQLAAIRKLRERR